MKQKEEIAFQNWFEAWSIAGLQIAQEVLWKTYKTAPIIVQYIEKIRQEAVEEFRSGLLQKLRDDELGISNQSIEVKLSAIDIMTVIQSYNLHIK